MNSYYNTSINIDHSVLKDRNPSPEQNPYLITVTKDFFKNTANQSDFA